MVHLNCLALRSLNLCIPLSSSGDTAEGSRQWDPLHPALPCDWQDPSHLLLEAGAYLSLGISGEHSAQPHVCGKATWFCISNDVL